MSCSKKKEKKKTYGNGEESVADNTSAFKER